MLNVIAYRVKAVFPDVFSIRLANVGANGHLAVTKVL